MLQAPLFHGPPFGFLSLEQDGLSASGIDVGRCEVFQALMIALMVVVTDERSDLVFKVTRQEVVLQQDAILERLRPALDS